jgi:protein-L-isoaspartate O-methyltransferase
LSRAIILEIAPAAATAAVLAEMGVDAYTIEIVPELADQAASPGTAYILTSMLKADGYFG